MVHFSMPESVQISSEDTQSAFVLRVGGEVDLLSAPSLREHLMRLVGRRRPIVVDLSKIQYLDMKGVHVLEDCAQRAAEVRQPLVVVGSAPLVHKGLTIVQLRQRIPVVETMGEALKTLGQPQ